MALGVKYPVTAPVMTFTPTGSTVVTDIAPWSKDLKIGQPVDKADVTTYGNTNKQYVATIQDLTATWTLFLEPTGGIEDILLPRAAGSLIFGPAGSTAGNRKYTFVGFIDDFSLDFTMNEGAQASVSMAPTANLTRAAYP